MHSKISENLIRRKFCRWGRHASGRVKSERSWSTVIAKARTILKSTTENIPEMKDPQQPWKEKNIKHRFVPDAANFDQNHFFVSKRGARSFYMLY